MSTLSIGAMADGSYYLNELLKVVKTKASIYGRIALTYTNVSVTSDFEAANISTSSFSVLFRGR